VVGVAGPVGATGATGPVGATGPAPASLQNYLSGFIMAPGAPSAATSVTVQLGFAADNANAIYINVASPLTKTIAGAWAAGNNQPGLGTGLTAAANTWYHVFAFHPASGPDDIYFDTSLSAANRPGGTVPFRRIGSFFLNASKQVQQFVQIDDHFMWLSHVPAYSTNYSGNLNQVASALPVPPGLRIEFFGNLAMALASGGPSDYSSALVQITEIPNVTGSGDYLTTVTGTSVQAGTWFSCITDTTQSFRVIASGSAASFYIYINGYGYVDRRGKH
jgi:hypothetical protein